MEFCGAAPRYIIMQHGVLPPLIPNSEWINIWKGIFMPKVTFNEDLCKGCGLCVNACPKQIIELKKDVIFDKNISTVATILTNFNTL